MRLPQELKTQRLVIRPHRPEDFDGFYDFLSDPEATKYISFSNEERTREGSRAFFEEIIATYETQHPVFGLAIEEQATGAYVGFCGLVSLEHQLGAELFYVLLPAYRRQGYAKEMLQGLLAYAFDTLQVGRLVCFVSPENQPGIQTVTSIGMEDEGMTAHDAYPNEVHQFAIWRKNWGPNQD